MHQLLSSHSRNIINISAVILLILYCAINFYWNEPHVDFRPFTNGTNVAAVKKTEMDAAAAVQVITMKMKNKNTGAIKDFPYAEYMKNLSTITDEYETIEQIKTEPTIPETKISHFDVTDFDGNERTELYLSNIEPHIMIPVYKAKYKAVAAKRMVKDTTYKIDTVEIAGFRDSIQITKTISKIADKEENYYDIIWDNDFLATFKNVIKPLSDAALKDKITTSVVISGIDNEKAQLLAKETGLNVEYLTADEKLLKTIMRSNPGIILWKNGVLLHKWHYKKLPSWDAIKVQYLN